MFWQFTLYISFQGVFKITFQFISFVVSLSDMCFRDVHAHHSVFKGLRVSWA